MGLDMYAITIDKSFSNANPIPAVDASVVHEDYEGSVSPLACWRKFNHLHGWMSRLYRAKGGKDEDFNLSTVSLTKDDLDRLEVDLAKGLPHEAGFFFGGEEVYPEDVEYTKAFIKEAKAALDEGKTILYYAWW